MTNPFKFKVATLLRGPEADGLPQQLTQVGPAPERIGVEMIAISQGAEVEVAATLTPLGGGILVDADIASHVEGECVRCLEPLNWPLELHISQVFANDPDFIVGDPDDEEDAGSGDDVPLIHNDELDITQSVIDEVGLTLPFNPTCKGECKPLNIEGVTTGVSGEDKPTDLRWSGLEKFL